MSANNWTDCPKCKVVKSKALEYAESKLKKQYGKIPAYSELQPPEPRPMPATREVKLGKIQITFKDPDALHNQVDEYVKDQLATTIGILDEERESLEETRTEIVKKKLEKWFEWSEYVTVEIDLDADSATVIQRR